MNNYPVTFYSANIGLFKEKEKSSTLGSLVGTGVCPQKSTPKKTAIKKNSTEKTRRNQIPYRLTSIFSITLFFGVNFCGQSPASEVNLGHNRLKVWNLWLLWGFPSQLCSKWSPEPKTGIERHVWQFYTICDKKSAPKRKN